MHAGATSEPDAPSSTDFRTIVDALPAAIYTTDTTGKITYFNAAGKNLPAAQNDPGEGQG